MTIQRKSETELQTFGTDILVYEDSTDPQVSGNSGILSRSDAGFNNGLGLSRSPAPGSTLDATDFRWFWGMEELGDVGQWGGSGLDLYTYENGIGLSAGPSGAFTMMQIRRDLDLLGPNVFQPGMALNGFLGVRNEHTGPLAGNAAISILADNTGTGELVYQKSPTGGLTGREPVWRMRMTDDAPIGNFGGSEFAMVAHDNAGVETANPFTVLRSNPFSSSTNDYTPTILANGFLEAFQDHTGPFAGRGTIGITSAPNIVGVMRFRRSPTGAFDTGAQQRWVAGMSGDAETGGNAGSNYFIERRSDAGSIIDKPIEISRMTGGITFNEEYTFPTADGAASEYLMTDGAGNLSWQPVSGGGGSSNNWIHGNGGANFTTAPNGSGSNSIASGDQAVSSGINAIAIGGESLSSGVRSIAIGYRSDATNTDAIAIGLASRAVENATIAIGPTADASGQESIAIGQGSNAFGNKSIAIGELATVDCLSGVAIGDRAEARGLVNIGQSTAVGDHAQANSQYATAYGGISRAENTHSTAIGYSSRANLFSGTNFSTALGNGAVADGEECIAIGYSASAIVFTSTPNGSYATAIGSISKANITGATAIGAKAEASGEDSLALGYNTQANALKAIAIGANTLINNDAETVKIGMDNSRYFEYANNGQFYTRGVNAQIVMPDYTRAQLNGLTAPTAPVAGAQVAVSDASGAGAGRVDYEPAFYNGTNWYYVSDNSLV